MILVLDSSDELSEELESQHSDSDADMAPILVTSALEEYRVV